jgi:hypothetical protein
MWWTPHPARPGPAQTGFHGLTTLTANCFLAAGLAFVGYMTVCTWRSRSTGPRRPAAGWQAVAVEADHEQLLGPQLEHSR